MSHNKNKKNLGQNFLKRETFWGKQWAQYATKQKLVLSLLVVILVSAVGVGIKNMFFPQRVQQASVLELPTREEIPGWWYKDYFGSSVCELDICADEADPDGDKLTNAQEFYYRTDPFKTHTVEDKDWNDGELVARGLDPSRPGRMTFDEVGEEDNVILESLVYDNDLKQLVAEANDISKVNIPEVPDARLQITHTNTNETYQTYLREFGATVNKYFTLEDAKQIKLMLETPESDIGNLPVRATMLAMDLEKIRVPTIFVTFHKHNISFYNLLAKILIVPATGSLKETDIWYDNVQAFLAVQQKLDFEKQVLAKQFGE